MSLGDVMIYMVQIDTWKQRFNAIIEYNNLENTKGYKFVIKNGTCVLDPPTLLQSVTRWYYGHKKEDLRDFLEFYRPNFFYFLEDINRSNIMKNDTIHVKNLKDTLLPFIIELSRSFSYCRNMYPDYSMLSDTLLIYYHKIRDWIIHNGY